MQKVQFINIPYSGLMNDVEICQIHTRVVSQDEISLYLLVLLPQKPRIRIKPLLKQSISENIFGQKQVRLR